MMKTLLLFAMCFLIVSLSAQNYTFTHGTLNSGGGHQSNSLYTVTTAVAEKVQGDISTTDYTGYLGFLFPILDQRPPVITSIDDVPNDQGREVQVVWNKCAYDDVYAIDTYYSVWRWDEDFERTDNPTTTLRMVDSPLERGVPIHRGGVCNLHNGSTAENTFTEPWKVIEQFREDPNKTYYWQRDREVWTFIDEVPALQYDEYALIAPTLADSNAVDINFSTFKIVYHDLYEYYESAPDSGYSVDDLPPDETRAYITKISNNMRISWDEVTTGTYLGNSYEELNGVWYNIYAGDTPDFVCDETTYIETVTDLDYDYLLTSEDMKFFKIKVSDQAPVN